VNNHSGHQCPDTVRH